MKKKIFIGFISALIFNWSWAAGLSSPTYISYSASFSEKKTAIKNVMDAAKSANSKNIYIYYHDDKSQKMANNIQSKIQDKLPSGCKVNVVNQSGGTPAYPSSATTPADGVAMFFDTN